MRTLIASILVVLFIAASRALAGDLAYQLETTTLTASDETPASPAVALTINDREWVTSGIEEALEPGGRSGYSGEKSPSACVSSDMCSNRLWAKLELWPRTSQLLSEFEKNKNPPLFHLGLPLPR